MKLIVGLGNIGKEYEHTRHNVGFDTIDILADKLNVSFKDESRFKGSIANATVEGHKAILLKPSTYMNLSGDSVILVAKYYKIAVDDIIIISDDLDMAPGKVRLRFKGSAGGHNGLKSIISNLQTEEFKRIKIGIDRDKMIPVVDWVLGRPKDSDKDALDKAFNHVADVLKDYIMYEDDKRLATKIAL